MADPAAIRRAWLRLAMLAPAVLVVGAALALPLAIMAAYSLMRYVPGQVTDGTLSLESYARLFGSWFYIGVVGQTLELAAFVTAAALLLGYPVAFWLAHTRSRWRGVLAYLVFVPLTVGIVVRIYGWIVILGGKGLVNGALVGAGLVHAPFRLLPSSGAVVAGLVETSLPFMITPLLSCLRGIDPRTAEAARATGASPWQAFRRVTLPLSAPGIVAGSLITFSLSITAYALPALLGGTRVKMIAGLAYDAMLVGSNWPFGSAIGIAMTVVTAGVVFAYLRGVSRWA